MRKGRFVTAIGIGSSAERTHSALHDVALKVFEGVQVRHVDFGRGNAQPRAAAASKSAVLSLFLSLHKQRKEIA